MFDLFIKYLLTGLTMLNIARIIEIKKKEVKDE